MTLGLVACADASHNTTTGEGSTVEVKQAVSDETVEVEEINETASDEMTTVEETKENVSDGTAIDEESNLNSQETVSASSEKNVLVVYFSVTGNTKNVAEKIAAVADADIYEIKPAEEYTDADINYGDSNSRTSKEQNDSSVRPEIQSERISLEGYDIIYIGYPIWWAEEPRIMDTFVESYDFGDITMIPFRTSGSSSIGNSGKNLAKNAGSGKWLEGKRFNAAVSESEIEEWIGSLQ